MRRSVDGKVFRDDGSPVLIFRRRVAHWRKNPDPVCNECSKCNHMMCEGDYCKCRWCARYLDIPNDIVRILIAVLFLGLVARAQTISPVGPIPVVAGQCVGLTVSDGGPSPVWTVTGQGTIGSLGIYCAPTFVRPQNYSKGVQQLPNNNAYNIPVNTWPIHPMSATWLTRIASDAPTQSTYHVFRLTGAPRFIQALFNNAVDSSTPRQKVHAHLPWCLGCQDTLMPMLQPPDVEMQAGWSMDPYGAQSGGTGPDRHLFESNRATGTQYEFYQLTPDFHNVVVTPGNPTRIAFDTYQIRVLPSPQRLQVNGSACSSVTNFDGTAASTYLANVVSQETGSGGYSWHVMATIAANSYSCTASQFSNVTIAGSASNDPNMNVGSLGIFSATDNSIYGGPDAGGSSLVASSVDPQQWYANVANNILDPACNCVTAVHHAIRTTLANPMISGRVLPPATLYATGGHPFMQMASDGCTATVPAVCHSAYNLATSGLDACEKPTPWLSMSPTNCQYAHISFTGLTGAWAVLNDNADLTNSYCLKMVTDTFHFELHQNAADCSSNPPAVNATTFGAWQNTGQQFTQFDWLPYGGRVRLKASYNVAGFCVDTVPGCPYAKAILRTLQVYGLILLDGTVPSDDWDSGGLSNGFNPDETVQAAWLLVNTTSLRPFENFIEVVDPNGSQPNWTPTIINTVNNQAGVTNTNRVSVCVNGTTCTDINLQGTAVGIDHEEITLSGGTTYTPKVWVTGNVNTSYGCTLSPPITGASVTPMGVITAPVDSQMGHIERTKMACVAAADSQAVTYADVYFIPHDSDGSLRMLSGLLSLTFTDREGRLWYGQSINRGVGNGQYAAFGYAWSIPGAPYAPMYPSWNMFRNNWGTYPDGQLYGSGVSQSNDIAYRVAVANGNYTLTTYGEAGSENSGPGGNVYDVELQGSVAASFLDGWNLAGGSFKGYSRTYPVTVTNGILNIVFRDRQGKTSSPLGMSMSGLELKPAGGPPPVGHSVTFPGSTTINTSVMIGSTR